MIEVPEVDRGKWFSIDGALESILQSQCPFLTTLCSVLGCNSHGQFA
jgi:predicted NUDIX family NTP pyrophosphohydrolase